MSDIVERLRKLGGDTVGNYGMPIAHEATDEIESLRHQLATAERLLAESQAREDRFFFDHGLWHDRVTGQHMYTQDQYDQLRREAFHAGYAPDSTALDAAIAKAKREENEVCEGICNRFAGREMHPAECAAAIRMRRMADELKGGEQ